MFARLRVRVRVDQLFFILFQQEDGNIKSFTLGFPPSPPPLPPAAAAAAAPPPCRTLPNEEFDIVDFPDRPHDQPQQRVSFGHAFFFFLLIPSVIFAPLLAPSPSLHVPQIRGYVSRLLFPLATTVGLVDLSINLFGLIGGACTVTGAVTSFFLRLVSESVILSNTWYV